MSSERLAGGRGRFARRDEVFAARDRLEAAQQWQDTVAAIIGEIIGETGNDRQ